MALDIDWNSIVGSKTVTDGGYVGDFMEVARAHLSQAVDNGEITQAQVGEVYSAMIPSAFQQGMQFAMSEKISEVQADNEVLRGQLLEKDLASKAIQDAIAYRQVTLTEKQIIETASSTRRAEEMNAKEIASKTLNDVITNRKILLTEKQVAETTDATKRANTALTDSLATSRGQRAQANRAIRLTEAQIAEQLTDTGRKSNWSAKDLETKNVEIAMTARQILKLEKDISMAQAEHQLNMQRMSVETAGKTAGNVLVQRNIALAEKTIATKSEELQVLMSEIQVKEAEVAKAKADTALTTRQIFKVENEAKLVDEQVRSAAKQRTKTDADIAVTQRTAAKLEHDIKISESDARLKELTTNASLAMSARDIAVKEKELRLQQLTAEAKEIDNNVLRDPGYIGDKLAILSAERKTAEAKADATSVERLILDENYKTEQEKNGSVSYNYEYYWTFVDHTKSVRYIRRDQMDRDANGHILDTYTESIHEQVIVNGIGETEVVPGVYGTTSVPVTEQFYSILVDGNNHNTKLSVRDNPDIHTTGAYVIKTNQDGFIVVLINPNDDTATGADVRYLGVVTDEVRALADIDGNPRTPAEWEDLFTADHTDDDVFTSYIAWYYKGTLVPDNNNVYNKLIAVNSSTSEESVEYVWYPVEDTSSVAAMTKDVHATGTGAIDPKDMSLVKLQKIELGKSTTREDDKVSLSKIPSTLR